MGRFWLRILTITIVLLSTNNLFTDGFSLGSWYNSHIDTSESEIYFNLYPNKTNLEYSETIIPWDAESLHKSSYNPALPVILLIHGFISNKLGEFIEIVKTAYLETDTKANIIGVDWSELGTPDAEMPIIFYPLAVKNVPRVGNTVSEFLQFLISEKVLDDPKNIHLVGHSLGAHVSGYAGQNFSKSTDTKIGRITGLDPAAPEFEDEELSYRLDSGDADFVDVVHTDEGQSGYRGDLGHADFYPNGGGPSQPNCSYTSMFTGICAHSSSYKYFAKSIRDPNIVACACDDYIMTSWCLKPCKNPVIFGEHCPPTARGDYYLKIYF